MMSWMKTAPLLLLSVMLLWTNWQRMTQQEQLIEQNKNQAGRRQPANT